MSRDVLNRLAELVNFYEFFPLFGCLGDDPFACVAVRNGVAFAELIEKMSTSDTQGCF